MVRSLAFITAMLATATTTLAQVTPERATTIQSTIRALFDSGSTAWSRGNMEGYLAGYWDSPETRWAAGGSVIRGKPAIAAAFRSRFPSPEQMGTLAVDSVEIDALTERDALAFGRWVHTAGGAQRRGLFTVHLRRFGGKWFVVSDHSSTAGN